MLDYGGGGHQAAATCQVETDKLDEALAEITEHITLEN